LARGENGNCPPEIAEMEKAVAKLLKSMGFDEAPPGAFPPAGY
jgi:hypothetical protein